MDENKNSVEEQASDTGKKVGLMGLTALVASAMIGGGIYNLPSNMSQVASGIGMVLAWIITAVGMFFLANNFRILSAAKPDLKNGLYSYADDGFGKFTGFVVAWGYWISNCVALAAYSVLVMSSVNFFIPVFGNGSNTASVLAGSVITWIIFLLVNRGAKETATLNNIGIVGSVVPALVFIIALISAFRVSMFVHNFWGVISTRTVNGTLTYFFTSGHIDMGQIMSQAKGTMMIILWLFIGIEGAVVVSGRAKSQEVVRKSTMYGLAIVMFLDFLTSMLPLGVTTNQAIANMAKPSTATMGQQFFGSWLMILINVGIIISVLLSWVVWMLMMGEFPLYAAKQGVFPKYFDKENKHGAPGRSLFWTALIIQVLIILSHFATGDAWTLFITVCGVLSLPCYLFATLYLVKLLVKKNPGLENIFAGKAQSWITGIVSTIYAIWLLYASGLEYLMLSGVVYALGIILYAVARRQHKEKYFPEGFDKVLAIIIFALGVIGVIYLAIHGF